MIAIIAAFPAAIIAFICMAAAVHKSEKATPADAGLFLVGLAFQISALCVARFM